jgi:hypothetical protein
MANFKSKIRTLVKRKDGRYSYGITVPIKYVQTNELNLTTLYTVEIKEGEPNESEQRDGRSLLPAD